MAVVIGAGPIGMLFGLVFKAAGAKVIIADVAPTRLDMAQKAGLDVAVNVKPVNQYTITRHELTVIGTFVGEYTFPRAIQILESGAVKPSVLNTVLPLSEILTGITAARNGEIVKAIVTTD